MHKNNSSNKANVAALASPRLPPPSSELWDLVVDRNWPRVLEHVQYYPEDAAWSDGHYRETVLYLACQSKPPLQVVRRLIEAYPAALMEKCTKNHDYPLHIACRYQLDLDILSALVENCPETAVLQTRWGKTPIMALWEHRLQLQQQQEKEERELARLIRFRMRQQRRREEGRHREAETLHLFAFVNDDDDDDADDDDDEHVQAALEAARSRNRSLLQPIDEDEMFWAKVTLIISAVARYRAQESEEQDPPNHDVNEKESPKKPSSTSSPPRSEPFLAIHAAVSLGAMGCPLPVLEKIMQNHSHQAQMRDCFGRLPLHLAIGPASWNRKGTGGQRKYRPREGHIIRALLSKYPAAAKERIMEDGRRRRRYPLHEALINRHWWNEGIREVFQACPQALKEPDVESGLYPFQLAALLPEAYQEQTGTTSTMDVGSVDLETIFQLLRAEPNVLEFFVNEHSDHRLTSGGLHDDTKPSGIAPRTMSRRVSKETMLGCAAAFLIGGVMGTLPASQK